MRKFDTKVQYLTYKVLREVARHAYNDTLVDSYFEIPKLIVKDEATMRCCIYKERAIVEERIKLAMGGDKSNPNVIEVLEIACEDCPASGYNVTSSCRGCLAHRCEDVCKFGAITFDSNNKAIIDKTKCVNCGQCAKVCPYSAITNSKRPCEKACKTAKAISTNPKTGASVIDNDKCTQCGACVYQCPFGAIVDKSFIVDAVKMIKQGSTVGGAEVVAIVAPAIGSQFKYAKLGQIITAMHKLGFDSVFEAALGADMIAYKESRELSEKEFLTSSCCPAFVKYIEVNFPKLVDKISSNLSPMAEIARAIKAKKPTAKVIFVGPCTAKKMEIQKPTVSPYVDCVITFEELQALIDSRDIEVESLEETPLDDASFFGRIFARSGGVSQAVKQAVAEQGLDLEVNAMVCHGLDECRTALLKANKGVLPNNFLEGMACIGGCLGGAGCLTHGDNFAKTIDEHGKQGKETIKEALDKWNND